MKNHLFRDSRIVPGSCAEVVLNDGVFNVVCLAPEREHPTESELFWAMQDQYEAYAEAKRNER